MSEASDVSATDIWLYVALANPENTRVSDDPLAIREAMRERPDPPSPVPEEPATESDEEDEEGTSWHNPRHRRVGAASDVRSEPRFRDVDHSGGDEETNGETDGEAAAVGHPGGALRGARGQEDEGDDEDEDEGEDDEDCEDEGGEDGDDLDEVGGDMDGMGCDDDPRGERGRDSEALGRLSPLVSERDSDVASVRSDLFRRCVGGRCAPCAWRPWCRCGLAEVSHVFGDRVPFRRCVGGRCALAEVSRVLGDRWPMCATIKVCHGRGVPRSRCAAIEVCHNQGVPQPRCAVIEVCRDRGVPQPRCATVRGCATVEVCVGVVRLQRRHLRQCRPCHPLRRRRARTRSTARARAPGRANAARSLAFAVTRIGLIPRGRLRAIPGVVDRLGFRGHNERCRALRAFGARHGDLRGIRFLQL